MLVAELLIAAGVVLGVVTDWRARHKEFRRRGLIMPVTFSHDLVTGIFSFLLTLMILSYLIGDNPAFRVAVYIFVGVSAGYVAAVAWWQVLYPKPPGPLGSRPALSSVCCRWFALVLGVLLLMKLSPRTAWLGNPIHGFPGGGGRSGGCWRGGNGDAHSADPGVHSMFSTCRMPDNPGWSACSLERSCWSVR